MEYQKKTCLMGAATMAVSFPLLVFLHIEPSGMVIRALMSFFTGAVTAAVMVSWGRYRRNRMAFNWDEKEYDKRLAEQGKKMKDYWKKHRGTKK